MYVIKVKTTPGMCVLSQRCDMKSTSTKQNEAQYMQMATLICLVGELEKLLKSFYWSQYFQHV